MENPIPVFHEKRKFKIASRSSALALAQVEETISLLLAKNSFLQKEDFEIVEISNEEGDTNLKDPLYLIGTTGLFTKLERKADFCVHSLKDLPTQIDKSLKLAAITPFAPRADVVILRDQKDLPKGAVLGTASLRRIANFKEKHPHLVLKNIRGNLNTRFKKLFEGNEFDGIILAEAGVVRLGMKNLISFRLEPSEYLYAPAQGTLGIECLSENEPILNLLKSIDDFTARKIAEAERQFLSVLEGGCKLPIGVFSSVDGESLTLKGQVWDYSGTRTICKSITRPISDSEIGRLLALEILENGGEEILKSIKM